MRALVQLKSQAQIRELRGQLQWEGDLDALRLDRLTDELPPEPGEAEPSEGPHVECGQFSLDCPLPRDGDAAARCTPENQ